MDCGLTNTKNNKSILEMALDIQKECGWVSEEKVKEIACCKGMPVSRVYETLSFYSMILLEKPAPIRIEVCRGTSCYIANGVNLLKEIEEMTGCKIGEVSKDGKFQLEYCECLGHCESAPNVMINGKLCTSVTKEKLCELVKEVTL